MSNAGVITFTAGTPIGFASQPNSWAPLGKIAERLGVKPLEARERRPATHVFSGAEYLPMNGSHTAPTYDLFEVVEALLDRLDKIDTIKESAAAQGKVT